MKLSTERDYRLRIARVVETILIDPGAPHTVESLAAVAHFSPFHFHRIYRALTGETIAQTIQRSRLAQAAHQLKDGAASVIAIALDAGYDSPQAFARAFRGFTGITPSEFRARQAGLSGAGAPLRSGAPGTPGAASPEASNKAIGASNVEIIELPPRDVLCLRHNGPIATIGQTYRELFRTLGINRTPTQTVIGISFGDPEAPGNLRYHAGIEPAAPIDPAGTDPPGAVETMRLAGGLYAGYRLAGPGTLIAPTFQTLFGGWLPRSGYDPDDRPALELYRGCSTPGARSGCVTDLLIPIRRK